MIARAVIRGLILLAFGMACAIAKPRNPLPPMPEFAPVLFHESFDAAYAYQATNAQVSVANSGEFVESWSGYALQRDGPAVPAFILPALDDKGHTNVACHSGAVRFWLKPYWSSASVPKGTGAGTYARLIELVVGNKQSAVIFSLQVTPDGSALELIGEGGKGSVALLKAEIGWQAGEWHMLALNYGPRTELFVDGQLAAEGSGTVAVPPELAGVVIGSSLAGTDTFGGEFEDVYLLSRHLTDRAVAVSYGFKSAQAKRGPISPAEEAAWIESVANGKAEREAAAKDGGEQMMLLVGGTTDCVTGVPVYITNFHTTFVSDQGWTVTFDIQGGATGLLYDLFRADKLAGSSIANSEWTWLESGPTCSTYQNTSQPPQAFYVVTTPGADQDGDGLYDGWEWKHFGTLAQGANQDYDQDGVNNFDEYVGGTDPNTLEFDVEFANFYTSADTATGLVVVAKGVPAEMAILVNDTNFAEAPWTAFTSTPTVNLGSSDGDFEVWIAVRGRTETAEIVWERFSFTRDTASPLVVVTDPVSNVTSRPVMQLIGYTPEPLASLHFDVANSAGSVTDEQGFVTSQLFDSTVFRFTTNWFQCFDIELAAGLNTITLRAEDQAGNLTTTVLTYTLDFTGDTTAPVITLHWPKNNTQIS